MQRSIKDQRLLQLSAELQTVQRRAAQYRRRIKTDNAAWQRWSATLDHAAQLATQIRAVPARSLLDLSCKLDAIVWQLERDDAILDTELSRQLHTFGREMRRLAKTPAG